MKKEEIKEEIKEEKVKNEEIKEEKEIDKKEKKKEVKKNKEEVKEKIKEQEFLILELQSKILREKADNINYRKRKEKEVDTFKKYASESLIKELLETVDDLERAIKIDDNDLTDDLSKMLEGFKMVYSSLILKLENNGVKMINPLNEKFDPNYHQSLLTDKVEGMEPDMVIEVLQKGYLLNERLLRPAMVKISI